VNRRSQQVQLFWDGGSKKEEERWNCDGEQVNVEDEHSIVLKTAMELVVQLGMKTKYV
jgi:hypothetical protein